MQQYSRALKATMVSKLCSPGGPTAYQLSKETGISQGSLNNWVRAFGEVGQVGKNRRPEDWSSEERLLAVLDAQNLDELELGEFLRKNGLHSNRLDEWRQDALEAAKSKTGRGRPRKDPELLALQNENKELKRDLRRKDRALAEQTALVILKKKVQELWGQGEDDE